ncbi:MAG: sn-glycerol-3-phosphate ABC transporter ATP-binding protein UgpC [Chloroflexi bacterium]|nr:sn-glycerol-3-phosphate ABC transporter ATP-binding protein UgpC [Chloroflexota bacterium]
MASVRFDHVVKRFGSLTVLHDLAFEVQDGEFLVLVGPSGCGKSTALRLLAGLEEVTAGEIYIGERRVTHLPPKDRDIAMVFQSYALYPHMTVYDNLAFGLKLRGTPRAEIARRVEAVAATLGLKDLLQRKPRQLSGGQRQRVALGRAIVREPRVFLMDEPLSNLDANLRVQTRAELLRLHQRLRTTVVYVTHDQVEAMTMGQRIAVLNAGRLQQLAPPQVLYDHPANRFVAGFIGSPAMNFLEAELTADERGALWVVNGALRLQLPRERSPHVETPRERAVVVGIRPEDLTWLPDGEALPGTTAPARVEVVEYLGAELLAHLRLGEHTVIARLPGESAVRPQAVGTVAFNTAKLHLFDPESERALT